MDDMVKVSSQKVVGVLRAKGIGAAKWDKAEERWNRNGFRLSRHVVVGEGKPYLLGYGVRLCGTGYTVRQECEAAQSYLAALAAAGIECHLADDGRTVIVEVEQEGGL